VQGAAEVAPGVRVWPVGGHTAYHQMVSVEGGGQGLLIPTDLLPTTSHVPLAYVMAYDLFPLGTMAAKQRLLREVVERDWNVLFYHDPRTPLGKLKRVKDRYEWSEVRA
jgi:glyoxylase-like metal-dependent hydrolase (beta-lactamase superfamily II)